MKGTKLFGKLKGLLTQGNKRSVNAKKNILLTIILKGAGVIIGFLYFPLSLDYLGAVKFGIFLTLLSIIDWFLNFDIGIGHGLRNKFGEAVANDKPEQAVRYISSAYFALGAVIAGVTLVLLVLNYLLPWTQWLSIPGQWETEVKTLGIIVIIAFGIRFVTANIYQIFYAMQRMAYVEFFGLITKASFLILILLIPFIIEDSLLLFGTARSLTFALVPLAVGIYFFRTQFAIYRPKLKFVRWSYFKDLFSLGYKFFLIKISMLIIHQTNNMLIASFVSLEGVPQYEAAYKYLSIFMMLFVILNNQLWPSNLEAYAKGDFKWMRKSKNAVMKVWFGTLILAGLMLLISPWVYSLWLGNSLEVPMGISLAVAGSIAITTWVNMHNLVLNGTGKINLQMWSWVAAAVLNIPISLFFVKVMNLGVIGIVLGTIICMIPLAILSPVQVGKILKQSDRGIWSK